MEMEHINDNTIRVVIENADLEDRGITFLDLMGNQKEIEKFFYSILEEVDVEAQFRDTDAVSFPVLPTRNGLELFISKNLNLNDEFSIDDMPADAPVDDVADFLKERLNAKRNEPSEKRSIWLDKDQFVYELPDFETVIAMANNISLIDVVSGLYAYHDKYYFTMNYVNNDVTDYEKHVDRAVVLEYAKPSKLTESYLAEHGKRLMQQAALQLLQHYFK